MSAGPLGRLTVRQAAASRHGVPLTCGVPLPRGRVRDAARLVAVGDGPLPTQAQALDHWPDGSIRWALLDTRAGLATATTLLEIRDDLTAPATSQPLTTSISPRRATVASGDLRVELDLDRGQPFAAFTVGERPVIDTARTAVHLADAQGQPLPVRFSAIAAEVSGPLRVVLTVDGDAGAEASRFNVQLRLTFLAGLPVMGLELALHNPNAATHPGGFWELGDPGSLLLGHALVLVALAQPAVGCRASLERDAPLRDEALPFAVTQHASGGAHWNSPVHVTRTGAVTLDRRGYTVTSGTAQREGLRASPLVAVTGPSGELWCTAERFWEVFPKAVTVAADGVVTVGMLPAGPSPHELQGGERCDSECWLAWGDDGVGPLPLEWRRSPATVLPEPEAVAGAEHLPGVERTRPGENALYERLVGAAVDGDDTFASKRERIDEYGWRHYGDLYADHENGAEPRQIVSHYNNQYDPVHGLTVQALRHDDHRWWDLARDLARHVSRIDVYWTDRDRAAYSGGLFWHSAHYVDAGTSTHRTYPRVAGLDGGGPSNEHCYSNGLMLHYFLTGDRTCRAAVLSLANWILAMDDGRRARFPLPWLSGAPTGAASATVSGDYHGPGRGPANAVQTLLNAHRLTGEARYADYADALVRRVVHPADDPDALELLDAERRWSYAVMLQALGKYLAVREEVSGRDDRWNYARAVLLHYARWMAAHEKLALSQPERLEYPTETWAAQDVRKAEVFDLAARHAPTAEEREHFLERAQHYHRGSLEMLAAMPTHTWTRPVVLLLSYGYARPWYERTVRSAPLEPESAPSWPPPSRFVPQRVVAVRRLKHMAAAGALAGAAGLAALLRWLL